MQRVILGTKQLTFIFLWQVHQRTPIFIGSPGEVEKIQKYLA